MALDTRQRILIAAQKLSYRPNLAARALRMRRSKSIALICRMSSPIYSRVAHLISLRLHARGYWLMICNSNEDPAREAEYLHQLPERGIDGAIVIPATREPSQITNNIAADFPMVILHRPVEGLAPTVAPDRQQAGELFCQTLASAGVRRIALITGPQAFYGQSVYTRILEREMSVVARFDGPFSRNAGRQAYHALMCQPQPRFDAIVCTVPLLAQGFFQAIPSFNAHDPMPIIAVNDSIQLMHLLPIPVVCLVSNLAAMAEGCVSVLLSMLENRDATGSQCVVPPLSLFPSHIEFNGAFAALQKRGES
jgi:LacI family transcriptional regulator